MKIVFCWSALSGYMAACWKELASRAGIDLHVIAHGSANVSPFHDDLLRGLSHRLLNAAERDDCDTIEKLVADQRPDVIVTTGWWLKAYRNLAHSKHLGRAKFVMGVDSPWRHEAQILNRLRYWSSLKRFDHFFVTGERSWQYVTRLGVPPSRISRGMYGVDVAALRRVGALRNKAQWPRQFLFLGRYEPVKAVDSLVAGYQLYREAVADPWTLVSCGTGPDRHIVAEQPGVIDKGFVQPSDLAEVLVGSGAFVLPSRFDPWPLALVEAAAAGLPIVCTDACGSGVELVRPMYNGFVVPTDSPAALARALVGLHQRYEILPQWGSRSEQLAEPYSAQIWADRWVDVCSRLIGT